MSGLCFTLLTLALMSTTTSADEDSKVKPKDSFIQQQVIKEDTTTENKVPTKKQVTSDHDHLYDLSQLEPNFIGVFELDDLTFQKMIESSGKTPIIVMFHVKHCQHCKELRDVWEELGNLICAVQV